MSVYVKDIISNIEDVEFALKVTLETLDGIKRNLKREKLTSIEIDNINKELDSEIKDHITWIQEYWL